MTNNKNGYIYIMTNKYMPGLVKIGYADDVERRRKELSNTSVAADFEVYGTYQVPVRLADKALHKLIQKLNPNLKVNVNREFFEMSPEDAYDILDAIAAITDTKDLLTKFDKVAPKPQISTTNTYQTTKSNAVAINKNFFIIRKGNKATLNFENGQYIVRAGSTIWVNFNDNNPKSREHQADVNAGLIAYDGVLGELKKDKAFNSPSGAAKYVYGCSVDGWTVWKAKDGTLLKQYYDILNGN